MVCCVWKCFKTAQIEGQLVGVDGATFIKGYCTIQSLTCILLLGMLPPAKIPAPHQDDMTFLGLRSPPKKSLATGILGRSSHSDLGQSWFFRWKKPSFVVGKYAIHAGIYIYIHYLYIHIIDNVFQSKKSHINEVITCWTWPPQLAMGCHRYLDRS